jgi:ketosteroid isomerase-like protein
VLDPQIVFTRTLPDYPGGPGEEGEWHGIDEMQNAIADWVRQWRDMRHEAEEFIDLGNRVLVLTRQRARGKLSGAPVEQSMADLFTLRDGRIVRWDLYSNREQAVPLD